MEDQPTPINGATILEMPPGQAAFQTAANQFGAALVQHIAQSGGQVDVASTIIRMNLMSCHMESILEVLAEHGVDVDETYKRAAATLTREAAKLQAPKIAIAQGFNNRKRQ
jgi:predicted transcriptional regulator